MNIAFYAPLKSPNSIVATGDRTMARNLIAALESAGYKVGIASEFQSREAAGDPNRQISLAADGRTIADNLIADYKKRPAQDRPDLWFTYHQYYKAVDWLGPRVSDEMGIPYVIAEASHAPKRAGGPWDFNHHAVAQAIEKSDLIIGLNSNDRACVLPLLKDADRYLTLAPFIKPPVSQKKSRQEYRSDLAREIKIDAGLVWLVTVAMMRPDVKRQSYEILATSIRNLQPSEFGLIVVGDGPARPEIESYFPAPTVCFVGEKSAGELSKFLYAADLFVWPAIGEAYGMAILEAQAYGLPVIAGHSGGVGDIVVDGSTGILVTAGDAGKFGNAVEKLINDPDLRSKMGSAALARYKKHHAIGLASKILDRAIRRLVS